MGEEERGIGPAVRGVEVYGGGDMGEEEGGGERVAFEGGVVEGGAGPVVWCVDVDGVKGG